MVGKKGLMKRSALMRGRIARTNPLTHPRWLLHAEGAVLLAASVAGFDAVGGHWWLFVLLPLTPDLSAVGYLVNPGFGATCYNSVHTLVLPVILLAIGIVTPHPLLSSLALVWLAHVGLDRLVGFGLKYPTKFQDTHLQRV